MNKTILFLKITFENNNINPQIAYIVHFKSFISTIENGKIKIIGIATILPSMQINKYEIIEAILIIFTT